MKKWIIEADENIKRRVRFLVLAESKEKAIRQYRSGNIERLENLSNETNLNIDDGSLAEVNLPEPTFMIRFVPQSVNEQEYYFDVEPEGDDSWPVSLQEILVDGKVPNDLDHLKHSILAPIWVREWEGPFEIEPVDPFEWDEFFDEFSHE